MATISYWFWSHLPLVITIAMILAVVGYGILFWVAYNDLKDWKEFFDAEDSKLHNKKY